MQVGIPVACNVCEVTPDNLIIILIEVKLYLGIVMR